MNAGGTIYPASRPTTVEVIVDQGGVVVEKHTDDASGWVTLYERTSTSQRVLGAYPAAT